VIVPGEGERSGGERESSRDVWLLETGGVVQQVERKPSENCLESDRSLSRHEKSRVPERGKGIWDGYVGNGKKDGEFETK